MEGIRGLYNDIYKKPLVSREPILTTTGLHTLFELRYSILYPSRLRPLRRFPEPWIGPDPAHSFSVHGELSAIIGCLAFASAVLERQNAFFAVAFVVPVGTRVGHSGEYVLPEDIFVSQWAGIIILQ